MEYVLRLEPDEITFVIKGGADNAEDLACAEYLQKQFLGQAVDTSNYIHRVISSRDAFQHMDDHPQFPRSDLDYCTRINAFDFAMPITRENNQLTVRAVKN
jgi:phosphosulfolactate phosphohydrolase-like enzyme